MSPISSVNQSLPNHKKNKPIQSLTFPQDSGEGPSNQKSGLLLGCPQNPVAQPKSPPKLIQTSNRFYPLLRPNNRENSSSFSSGPLFPPGFEDEIPLTRKLAHEKKRLKKLKKKKHQRLRTSLSGPPHESTTAVPISHMPPSLSIDSILELAEKLELSYQGSPSTLKKKIQEILVAQMADWKTNQA